MLMTEDMPESKKKALTPQDIADELQVSIYTVMRWLDSGQLRGLKLGAKMWRIEVEDLEDFKEKRANRRRKPKEKE